MSFLPGMTGPIAGAVARTIEFVASASSTSSTIVIPASAEVGDVAALFDFARASSGTPTDVIPTDWTGLVTDTDVAAGAGRLRCSYKVLVGGDPGATVTGMNSDAEDKVMLVFRPSFVIVSVTPSTWLAFVEASNPPSQNVSASGQVTPLIVLGCSVADVSTAAFNASTLPAFDGTAANSNSDMLAGYKIYNSGPANHVVDTDGGPNKNGLASGYLIVA